MPITPKLPYILVLAGNSREGRKYAKRKELPRGRHRVVYSAKQIRTTKRADIHILPSFYRRPDRHGILAALRYCKGQRFEVVMPESEFELDTRGPLTPRQHEAALRYNRLRAPSEDRFSLEDALVEAYSATPPEASKADDQEPSEPTDGSAARKRRSRCPVCGELVWSDDDPQHDDLKHIQASPPEAQESAPIPRPTTPGNFFGSA